MTELRDMLRDADIERALLGALLVDATAIAGVAAVVRPDDFAEERHAAIYTAVLAVGEHADLLTVATELDRRGALERVGGDAYIAELSGAAPTALNAAAYAQHVAELALRRRIVFEACSAIAKRAGDLTLDADGVLDFAQNEIIRAAGTSAHGIRPTSAIAADVWETYSRRVNGEPEPGVSTGLKDLDDALRKLRPGKLVIVAGRPGTGKTTLMTQAAAHAALNDRARVAVFTLEMSESEVVERVIANRTRLDMTKAKGHTAAESQRVAEELARVSASGLQVVYAAGWTPSRVVAECTRLKHGRGLDLVVVDYLQLLDVSGPKGSTRDAELAAATRALKTLAMRLDVPVVVGSQLNRDAANVEPQLHHLRESGGIESDADAVVMLHVSDEKQPSGVVAFIRKARDAATGRIDLYHHLGQYRFGLADVKAIGAAW